MKDRWKRKPVEWLTIRRRPGAGWSPLADCTAKEQAPTDGSVAIVVLDSPLLNGLPTLIGIGGCHRNRSLIEIAK